MYNTLINYCFSIWQLIISNPDVFTADSEEENDPESFEDWEVFDIPWVSPLKMFSFLYTYCEYCESVKT